MSVLGHILVLWGVAALVLGSIAVLHRTGVVSRGFDPGPATAFVGSVLGILLGLLVFFATQHFANAGTVSQQEATAVDVMSATAGSLGDRSAPRIRGQLICYAQDVIAYDYPAMADGHDHGAPRVDRREDVLQAAIDAVPREDAVTAQYGNLLSAETARAGARQQRLLTAGPSIPTEAWILAYLGAALMLGFAAVHHTEPSWGRRAMLLSVVVLLTGVVGAMASLDRPYQEPGRQSPNAMIEVLAQLRAAAPAQGVTVRC